MEPVRGSGKSLTSGHPGAQRTWGVQTIRAGPSEVGKGSTETEHNYSFKVRLEVQKPSVGKADRILDPEVLIESGQCFTKKLSGGKVQGPKKNI